VIDVLIHEKGEYKYYLHKLKLLIKQNNCKVNKHRHVITQ